MAECEIKISEDEAVILHEFFERFDDKERLYFVHPAEYLALMNISAQIDKNIAAKLFFKNYAEILSNARERIAKDFESDYPKIEKE